VMRYSCSFDRVFLPPLLAEVAPETRWFSGHVGHSGMAGFAEPAVLPASVLGIFRSGKFIRGIIFGEGKSSKRQTDV